MTPRRFLIVSMIWVLGTLALQCWVLFALANTPSWEAAKSDSRDMTETLNGALTGFEPNLEKRAQVRATMETQTNDLKLSYALRAEEKAQTYIRSMATMADTAGRRVARRAWISWAAIAFTPVIAVLTGKAVRQKMEKP